MKQPIQAWAPTDSIHFGEEAPTDDQEWTAIRTHEDFEAIIESLETSDAQLTEAD